MITKNQSIAFIVGSSLPASLVTFVYLIYFNNKNKSDIDYFSLTPLILIAFGIGSILNYIVIQKLKNPNYSLLVGVFFGLSLSFIGRFVIKIPKKTFKLKPNHEFIVHIIAPFIYALIFRYNIQNLQKITIG
tara:strand:+ start:32 stop:427 length:396 start_codon:yes stop_codon:yes gene_type:complete